MSVVDLLNVKFVQINRIDIECLATKNGARRSGRKFFSVRKMPNVLQRQDSDIGGWHGWGGWGGGGWGVVMASGQGEMRA